MGVKQYTRANITDRKGREIGYFTFDPDDSMMLLRFQQLRAVVNEVTEGLGQLDNISPDGKTAGSDTRQLRRLEKRLYSALDYFLGTDSSKHIFKELRPFACMSAGGFWFTVVIDGIIKTLFPELKNHKGE